MLITRSTRSLIFGLCTLTTYTQGCSNAAPDTTRADLQEESIAGDQDTPLLLIAAEFLEWAWNGISWIFGRILSIPGWGYLRLVHDGRGNRFERVSPARISQSTPLVELNRSAGSIVQLLMSEGNSSYPVVATLVFLKYPGLADVLSRGIQSKPRSTQLAIVHVVVDAMRSDALTPDERDGLRRRILEGRIRELYGEAYREIVEFHKECVEDCRSEAESRRGFDTSACIATCDGARDEAIRALGEPD
jgi:hypothetical protein